MQREKKCVAVRAVPVYDREHGRVGLVFENTRGANTYWGGCRDGVSIYFLWVFLRLFFEWIFVLQLVPAMESSR